jgi:hypothetical protein
MGGPIDLPSSRESSGILNSLPPGVQGNHVTRSEPELSMTFPRDSNLVVDGGDPFITQVQTAMKNNPISFPYTGKIDGKMSQQLRDVITQFGWALKKKFPNKTIPAMVSGTGISQSGFMSAMNLLAGKDDTTTTKDVPVEKIAPNDLVKAFQSFFSKSHSGLPALYSGPIDGNMSKALMAAAMVAETVISSAIKTPVSGTIIQNNKFNTTPNDVEEALSIIQKHKLATNLNAKGRILALSAIFNK